MAEPASLTFRCPPGVASAVKGAAALDGQNASQWLLQAITGALQTKGFALDVADQQYALVSNGELVLSPGGNHITTFRPANPTPHVGEWWPIDNVDSVPFDGAKHYRLKPLPLRVEGDRVVRVYPVVDQEHA